MGFVRRCSVCFLLAVALGSTVRAQIAPHDPHAFQFEQLAHRKQVPREPAGFIEHVAEGKLTLSLDDAIHLALENNTDIRVDEQQVQTAKDSLERALAPFDTNVLASFDSQRERQNAYTELLGGPPTLDSLNQTTQVGVTQMLETGTTFQATFNSFKTSSNSTFFFFTPAFFTTLEFSVTQPLLRGRGMFVNRAPIVIAQRGLGKSRAAFEGQVNDILLKVIEDYWNVVQARESLRVDRESLDEAQKSYDHDKHALELGALAPLDIYRSQSQVASRRVSVIQGEYFVKQQEDQLRRDLGADIDPNIRALELNLTDTPDPAGSVMSIDIPTALNKAFAYLPEIESMRQQLVADDVSVRVARNGLQPDLSLTGNYTASGLNSNIVNDVPLAGNYGSAIGQMFGFGFPTYEFNLTLKYPFRNHQAQAAMGDALASQRADLYSDRLLHEQITLDVTNAVNSLDGSERSMEAAKVALDLAQKTLQADQHKYELGAETVFFVLEAQTELTQAEQTLVQTQVNYQDAAAQVDHDTGNLLTRYAVQIAGLSN
ncbi:MAG TPA: TolC family protein [Candidatus Acidoferrum sp.]|nr:TolC family protein [Candidatus Acidoferrum sp.]